MEEPAMRLWGKDLSAGDVRRYCGSLQQVAGVRRFTYSEGKATGLDAVELRTGSGLRYVVLPGRGMDIGMADYCGIPLAFYSEVGDANPNYFEPVGAGLLRNYAGGLLMTAGLTQVGAPGDDSGEALGLHGRISNIPAEEVAAGSCGDKADEYGFYVKGKVREACSLAGPNLLLKRCITSRFGGNKILIEDSVTNEGFQESPHMILYHINLGFPILDAGSEFVANSRSVRAKDEVAQQQQDHYRVYDGPTPGYPDIVFYHDLAPDENGWAAAALINRRLNMGIGIRFDKATLPNFVQWKYTNVGDYVTGMEPANCLAEGRIKQRQIGNLVMLKPGESKHYTVEINVLTDKDDLDSFSR
jgi:hypothetical protein